RVVVASLGTDGDSESDACPADNRCSARCGERLLPLAKVPLALDSEQLASGGNKLRDVRNTFVRALGDAEAGRDRRIGSGLDQRRNRGILDGYQAATAGAGIGGSGQRHLGKQNQVASLGRGLAEQFQVRFQVVLDLALLALERRQQ